MELGDFKDVRYSEKSDVFTFVDEAGSVKHVSAKALSMLQSPKYFLGLKVGSGCLGYTDAELRALEQFNVEVPKISSTLVKSSSRLVAFLYYLLNHYIPCIYVDEINEKIAELQAGGDDSFTFSNGWLAGYAEDIARHLLEDGTTIRDFSVKADELPTAHGGVVGA